MNKIEYYPAGSKEAFIAAIEAGTDAVYCGLQNFTFSLEDDLKNITILAKKIFTLTAFFIFQGSLF
ncbi:MAG: hypothetical protein LBQ04_00825 [Endomicrobium sp.]|nr:hypothetical protein [Endomicrobium sp.]